MPNSRTASSAPFSMRLDGALRARLEEEAKKADRSASWVAARAIEAFLDARDDRRQAIETAVQEAEKGVFVSSKAVGQWMETWGTPQEAPFPEADVKPRRR